MNSMNSKIPANPINSAEPTSPTTPVGQDFKQELSAIISERIGYSLTEGNIHSDFPGFHYYIRRLQEPILVIHYRGPLMLVLPDADYQRLERGDISAAEYVGTQRFSYGYYCAGGSPFGAYWQVLEDTVGIHDAQRISRYLHLLSCRVLFKVAGTEPTEEQCQTCALDCTACPMSPLNQKGNWWSETGEPDCRKDLHRAVKKLIKRTLGFDSIHLVPHLCGVDEVRLLPMGQSNAVQIELSTDLLNDLLYHPVTCDWDERLQGFKFIATKIYPDDKDEIELSLDDPGVRQTCLDFWGENTRAQWENWDRTAARLEAEAAARAQNDYPVDIVVAPRSHHGDNSVSTLPSWLRGIASLFTRTHK